MNTVVHTELYNIWEGRVIVDEIRQFNDERGMLAELWRVDDDKINTSLSLKSPQMSYWSHTNSLVLRGPHEHLSQTDFFISWFNCMVYQLYNKETKQMFHFITDPTKIYRIKVDIGIIHSYRNLELRPITTGNFPTSLFMGENKKSPIDEIRHEDKISEDIATYVVIGANGRLGKAVTDYLFNNMGYHKYHVIPIIDKLNCEADVKKLFDELTKTTPIICHPENMIIINCAALTNVQKLVEYSNEVRWCNVELPVSLAKKSKLYDCQFYQISTDYVYRENDESVYTASKKDMETNLKGLNANIVRVANLFSLDKNDTQNIISKLKVKVLAGESLMVDPTQYVFPTDVNVLAEKLLSHINSRYIEPDINLYGKPMTIAYLYTLLGGKQITEIKSPIIFNVTEFVDGGNVINCKSQLLQKIKQ